MKSAKTNFFQRTLAVGALLAGGIMISQGAMACTLNNWSEQFGEGSTIFAGDPNDTIPTARYSGFCGMRVTGEGWVQDNNPNNLPRIVARFYVLKTAISGTAEIYSGYGDQSGGNKLFSVIMDNTGAVTLTDLVAAGSPSVSTPASSNEWVSIEVDWAQDSTNGGISLLVDSSDPLDAEVLNGLDNSGPNDLNSVRLGSLNGAAGTIIFDNYESRRSSSVGRLCEGEVTGDGTRTVDDVFEIFNEAASAGTVLSGGSPDFTQDGSVTVDDVFGVFNLVASAQGACS